MQDLEPHLQTLVADFESSLSTPSLHVVNRFDEIKSEFKKSGHDLLDRLGDGSRRIVVTATARFGRASRYYRELQDGPWKLDIDKLRHDFDDRAVLSRDFIVYIVEIQQTSANAAWPDILSKIIAARDARRTSPRPRISTGRSWAPQDVLDAARAFGLNLTPNSKRGRAQSASVTSSMHQGHPRRGFRLSALPTSSPSPTRTKRSPCPPADCTPPLPVQRTPSSPEERQHNLGRVTSPMVQEKNLIGGTGSNDAASEVSVELPRRDDAEILLGAEEYTFGATPDDSMQDLNEKNDVFNPLGTIERPSKRKRDSEPEKEHAAADEHTTPEEPRAPPINESDKAMEQLNGRNCVGQSAIHHILSAFALNNVRVIELAKDPFQSWSSWAQDHHYSLEEEQDVILIPLYLPRRSHWVLLHGQVARRKFTAYDSLRAPSGDPDISSAIQPICQALGFAPDAAWSFELDAHGPQQSNAYDCGVFVMVSSLYLMASPTLPRHINGAAWRHLFRRFLSQKNDDDEGAISDADMAVDSMLSDVQRPPQTRNLGPWAKKLKQTHQLLTQFADTIHDACLVIGQLSACKAKENREVAAEISSVKKRCHDRNALLGQLEEAMATDPFNGMAAAVDAARAAVQDAEATHARLKSALGRQHRVAAFHGALSIWDCRLSGDVRRYESELQAGVDELQEFLTSLKR